MEIDQDQQQALKQVKAFAAKSTVAGIPADLFYAIIGFSIGVGAALRSPTMMIIFLLFFGVPAYMIHKKDPHALKVLIKAIKRRQDYWSAGRSRKRELVIIQKEDL